MPKRTRQHADGVSGKRQAAILRQAAVTLTRRDAEQRQVSVMTLLNTPPSRTNVTALTAPAVSVSTTTRPSRNGIARPCGPLDRRLSLSATDHSLLAVIPGR